MRYLKYICMLSHVLLHLHMPQKSAGLLVFMSTNLISTISSRYSSFEHPKHKYRLFDKEKLQFYVLKVCLFMACIL